MPTVFWSWQSDLSARETRNVIRDALAEAIDRIAINLEDAERPEIDHDTRGVPGSPDIVATILRKIEQAGVFVADVTPIAIADGGKHVANPNVLIELGYAKKAITPDRVILVWNTAIHSSRPEDLPFDMRHRRAPISFQLPIGCNRADLRRVRTSLANELEAAIKSCLSAIPPDMSDQPRWAASDQSAIGVWEDNENGLPVNSGDEHPEIFISSDRFGYARLIPSNWSARTDAIQVLNNHQVAPIPLGRYGGVNWGATKGGYLVFRYSEHVGESGSTSTATRWYRDTGELWGADGNFVRENDNTQHYAEPYSIGRWVAWLRKAVDCCKILGGTAPFHVKIGIDDLRDVTWATNSHATRTIRALEPNAELSFTLMSDDASEIHAGVHTMANLMRAAFGLQPMSREDFAHQYLNSLS